MASICRLITNWFSKGTRNHGFVDDGETDTQKGDMKMEYNEDIIRVDGVALDRSKPRFEDLPLNPSHPQGSAWGLWGEDDERGTLNLITDEVTLAARHELRTGVVVPLK